MPVALDILVELQSANERAVRDAMDQWEEGTGLVLVKPVSGWEYVRLWVV